MKQKELVSNYKSNIFFTTFNSSDFGILSIPHLKKAIMLAKQLSENALQDEHELIYMIKSIKLISELSDENPYKYALMNAVNSQVFKYITGFVEIIWICSLALHLFNGSTNQIAVDLFFLFYIENVHANLQQQLKKNKPFYFAPALINMNMQQLIDSAIPKNIIINTFEFAKSSLNFLYHKVINSGSVQYELPPEIMIDVNKLQNHVF